MNVPELLVALTAIFIFVTLCVAEQRRHARVMSSFKRHSVNRERQLAEFAERRVSYKEREAHEYRLNAILAEPDHVVRAKLLDEYWERWGRR